ncbi:aspartate kinase [Alistipes sp. OttesenSCG-928-B03]|nr:aspartate kinase [Alistipes sp. OttesenSCG-928-B03]
MKVYKFGGASVRSAEGVKNLREIVAAEPGRLFVVVSAMGKTTNALEAVVERFTSGERAEALEALWECREYHREVCRGLFRMGMTPRVVEVLFKQLRTLIEETDHAAKSYDFWYDHIVGHGELMSTAIVSEYLATAGVENLWLDIRKCFVTDGRHRDATVDLEASERLLLNATAGQKLVVSQGFIGASAEGETTTLGREGSDYSAAVAANILDAESLTIWKDVEGVLTADPKIFPDAVFIPELTYLDAVELSYSGAQIIHPKTIKPLHNKNIPLYVRPFGAVEKPGSVIRAEVERGIEHPVLILKQRQVLVSIRPEDFSFVLEKRFGEIFSLLEANDIKINLIQSSAVSLTVCVDASRYLDDALDGLREKGFRVVHNADMQLLTIRGYTPELAEKYASGGNVYLTQKTRRTLRVVRREER